ncbi:GH1 family beta-glucosidase [Chitinivorax sp. B]|uniref:GH1 family beta-glucosidase n=1 Tax=Chitinivorax sp. B TaxID=2502235 RepID=UPI0010F53B11|nr:GH1 family beta-glucosidase [Chitinivorax sp. B]
MKPTDTQFMQFPRDFLWGAATSAYQIEGAADIDGRGPSIWDTFSRTPGKTRNGETGDIACEHYFRYENDIKLMSDLGLSGYRFSLSWSRVQPDGKGTWNEKGWDFYDRLVDELLEHGIRPFATLFHWDLPQTLQQEGGLTNRVVADYFANYAAQAVHRLGDRLASLATLNEPWCSAVLGHEQGKFAPGLRDTKLAYQAAHTLLLMHGKAIQAMRGTLASLPLGIVLNQAPIHTATNSEADRQQAAIDYALFVQWYMDPIFNGCYPTLGLETLGKNAPHYNENDFGLISQPIDFLGINYYTRGWTSTSKPPIQPPAPYGVNDMGWETYPEGLTELLFELQAKYKLPPIYITENGMAVADQCIDGRVTDTPRINFVQHHLQALNHAMQRGLDVRGYFYWSLFDNYEWDSGYDKRFGLIHVDYTTQQRTLKDSALWYRDFIAKARLGIPLET